MVADPNKKPAFDSHMKQYNRGLPSDQRIKILKEGVILRQAKKKTNSVNA